ncbi:hypothetical protein KJ657_00170 [Patescibacteria group bacterium]|nr:hypothetical protein [Patescibacteria group bacterium]MBU1015493.1 hypothetical protein [Patescibacteria group bacterium]MBU1685416.1 hypothetical protein [Patescibacteria group bacterium]MBU1938377.1 hypothetical protein [Patescibacteria group bacterium]
MIIDKLIFQKHLEKGETVLFAAHKHWVEFLPPFIRILFFGFLLPWGFYLLGFRSSLFVTIVVVWTVLAAVRLLYDLIDWYSDVWLFTNMSIIIVEWHGLFSNTSQRIGYEDTEGVAFIIRGFWGTILRYGDITLRVISGSHVLLKNVRSPKKVELALIKHQGSYLNSREMADAGGLKQMLSQMVAHHLRHKK